MKILEYVVLDNCLSKYVNLTFVIWLGKLFFLYYICTRMSSICTLKMILRKRLRDGCGSDLSKEERLFGTR